MKTNRKQPHPDRNHKLKQIARQASRLEEAIDGLLCESEQARSLPPGSARTPSPPEGLARLQVRSKTRAAHTTREILEATRGASSLEIRNAYDGGAVFIINGLEIRLAPKPAALLEILAADDRPSPDSLVGFKPRREIEERLAKRFGVPPSRGAFNNLIFRLRDELERQARLNRYYIQIDPDVGLRFALQRAGIRGGQRPHPPLEIPPAAD